MPLMQHQVVLPYVSGLPRDVAINTFWTDSSTGTATSAAEAAHDALVDFYTVAPTPAEDSIGYYLSPIIDRTADACYVRSYDMSQPKPRSIVLQSQFTMSQSGNPSGLPLEVALCNSFRGTYPDGVNPARRRGRIFLGPVNLGAMAVGTNGRNFPEPEFQQVVVYASSNLASVLSTSAAQWVVHSRVSSSTAQVIAGWVDDEWDTQRRREVSATSRLPWSNLV